VFIVDPLRAESQRAPPVRSVLLRPRALNTTYPFQSISETVLGWAGSSAGYQGITRSCRWMCEV
jgi:hypothetical protein